MSPLHALRVLLGYGFETSPPSVQRNAEPRRNAKHGNDVLVPNSLPRHPQYRTLLTAITLDVPVPPHPRAMKIFNPGPELCFAIGGCRGREHSGRGIGNVASSFSSSHARQIRAQSHPCELGYVFPTDQRVLRPGCAREGSIFWGWDGSAKVRIRSVCFPSHLPCLCRFAASLARIPAVRALADRGLALAGVACLPVFVLAPVFPRPQSMQYTHRKYERKTTPASGGPEFQGDGEHHEDGMEQRVPKCVFLPSFLLFLFALLRSCCVGVLVFAFVLSIQRGCLTTVRPNGGSVAPCRAGRRRRMIRNEDDSWGLVSAVEHVTTNEGGQRLCRAASAVFLPFLPLPFPPIVSFPPSSVVPLPSPQRAILPSSKLYLRLIAHAEYDEDGMGRTRGVVVLFPYLIDVGRGIPRRLILIYLLRPRQLKRDEARRIPAKGPPDFIGIGWVDVGASAYCAHRLTLEEAHSLDEARTLAPPADMRKIRATLGRFIGIGWDGWCGMWNST
ncbi:hypothetical protein C8R45DRAFT_1100679 [Mycena sanguinolenta]|nr:hypothetical protein C8R45DRAFT_1100679 [Mycena sanguinolenta]